MVKGIGLKDIMKKIFRRMPFIDDIFNLVNADLTLMETGGTLTSDGTEQNVYINNSPLGAFKPLVLKIDLDNMTATERIVIREYYREKSGGDLIQEDEETFEGVDGGLEDDNKKISIHLDPNRFGVQVTLELEIGTNRDFDWEVFTEA